jgi:hypothetical protein
MKKAIIRLLVIAAILYSVALGFARTVETPIGIGATLGIIAIIFAVRYYLVLRPVKALNAIYLKTHPILMGQVAKAYKELGIGTSPDADKVIINAILGGDYDEEVWPKLVTFSVGEDKKENLRIMFRALNGEYALTQRTVKMQIEKYDSSQNSFYGFAKAVFLKYFYTPYKGIEVTGGELALHGQEAFRKMLQLVMPENSYMAYKFCK